MSRRLAFTVALILLSFCTFFGIALLLSSNSQNNAQNTQTLQIFLDKDLLTLYGGQSLWVDVYAEVNNRTIWLKNTGPIPLENLSLIPLPFPANITLSWDCEGCTLAPYGIKQGTLTLTVPSPCNLKRICITGAFYIVCTTLHK
jgi:hypothetical protein